MNAHDVQKIVIYIGMVLMFGGSIVWAVRRIMRK